MPASPIVIDRAFAAPLLPKRTAGAHKWGIGGLLVIAGAPQYTGAAWLASRAAGRAGAGIVILASGRSVIGTLSGVLPEVVHVILSESDSASGSKRTLDLLDEYLRKAKAVVIGPGLGDDEASVALLAAVFGARTSPTVRNREGFGFRLLSTTTGNEAPDDAAHEQGSVPLFGDGDLHVVIDADALNWLAKREEWWTTLPAGRAILTPHVGEFSRLTGLETDEILKDPAGHAADFATKWQQTVVLKAGRTIVTDGTTTRIAETESLALATAGSGDVFSGTIGALLAQGLAPLDAASVAIALGAIAAETLAAEFGEAGVISTDLPDAIARATRSLAP